MTIEQANVAREIQNAKSSGMTSVQANVAKEIQNAKGSGKTKCDPLAGLYKTGLVSWC